MIIKTTEKNWFYRLCTIVIFRTHNEKRVMKSKFMYGKNQKGYFLRPLGVLYPLFNISFELSEVTKKWNDI